MQFWGYWWIPVTIVTYVLHAYMSKHNNTGSTLWFCIAWSFGLFPLWAIITKYSKNLMLDSMIYDVFSTIAYALALMYFTDSFEKFGITQYVGCIIMVLGLIIFKIGT